MIKYPYSDFHEMNLNWILEKVKELEDIKNFITPKKQKTIAGDWVNFTLSETYLGLAVTVGTTVGDFSVFIITSNENGVTGERVIPSSGATYTTMLLSEVTHGVRFQSAVNHSGTVVMLLDFDGKSEIYG